MVLCCLIFFSEGVFWLSIKQIYKNKLKKQTVFKKGLFSLIKGLFSLIKSLFSLIKSLFSLIKGLFSTTLTLGFTGVPECLKYLNILKFLNSSAYEEILLCFLVFIWLEWRKIFQLKKNKRERIAGMKTKKQNLKLGEETPGPGRLFFTTY